MASYGDRLPEGLCWKPGSQWIYYRIEVAGHEVKRSTRTRDVREATRIRASEKAKLQASNPTRRQRGTLAELGGLDVVRAVGEGVTPKQVKAIEWAWGVVCAHFGPDASPRVIDKESCNEMLAANRLVITEDPESGEEIRTGLAGQSLIRCIWALQRMMPTAKRKGWITAIPDEWPEVNTDPANEAQAGKLHPPEILGLWVDAIAEQHAKDAARVYLETGYRYQEMQRLARSWMTVLPEPVNDSASGIQFAAVLRAPSKSTKKRKAREVMVTAVVVEIITRRSEGLKADKPCMKGRHLKAWDSARTVIGYEPIITPRDLRHCVRTYGGSFSGDQETARHVLGHGTATMSAQYDHMFATRLAGFGGAVVGSIFGVENRTSESGPGAADAVNDRRRGDRTPDILRVKEAAVLLRHASSCIHCAAAVAELLETHRIAHDGRTRKPDQVASVISLAEKRGAS